MALELVWTVFMLCRPWAIDDERLRELVDRPPISPARILGERLSTASPAARSSAWERRHEFLQRYYDALRRFFGGEWTVEFPPGTWLMKVRFRAACPLPAT